MKIIILLCILLTFCSSQGNFYQTLQAEAAKSNGGIPGNFGQYVNSISGKVASVSNSINRNTLDSILALGVPQDIVNFFKACSAANTLGTNTYNNYAITGMTGVYIKGVGGIYFEGNDAKFSYIEGRAQGNIVQQVEDKTRRKCKRKWFKRKCWDEHYTENRGLYQGEVDVIGQALAGHALRDVQGRIQGIIDISASFIISPQMTILE